MKINDTADNYYVGVVLSTKYGNLSRGKAWGRLDAKDKWAPKNGGSVTLDEPGEWTVGSSDGFNRKEKDSYTVLPEPPTISDEILAEIEAANGDNAKIIEKVMAARDGETLPRRWLSRRYYEACQRKETEEKAAKKAARKAAAEAMAAESAKDSENAN